MTDVSKLREQLWKATYGQEITSDDLRSLDHYPHLHKTFRTTERLVLDLIANERREAEVTRLTSEDWLILAQQIAPNFMILDPDGWDRKNYNYSWREEKITAEEFRSRCMMSTGQWPIGIYPNDILVSKYGAQLQPTKEDTDATA